MSVHTPSLGGTPSGHQRVGSDSEISPPEIEVVPLFCIRSIQGPGRTDGKNRACGAQLRVFAGALIVQFDWRGLTEILEYIAIILHLIDEG